MGRDVACRGYSLLVDSCWRMDHSSVAALEDDIFFARFASEDEAARAVIRSMSAAGVTMRVANFVFGADVGEITR